MATFVSELRCLTEFCNFGDILEDMIRDRLVCGINEDAIQKRLLAEPKLTYAKAVELAQNLERAGKNVRELRVKREPEGTTLPSHQGVHQVSGSSSTATGITCFRCGKSGHLATKCKLSREIVCRQCGKSGHIQKACKSRPRNTKPKKHSRQPVNRVEEEEEEDFGDSPLFHVRSQDSSKRVRPAPIEVRVKVDDCLISMQVDTGASMTIMSETTFKGLWPGRSLDATDARPISYTKEPIPVVGCCYVNIDYNQQTVANLPLVIVRDSGPTLLGRDWLSQIRLDWHGICQGVYHVQGDRLQAILDRHAPVFQEGLGTMLGVEAKIHVDSNATPRYHRARSVPYAFREKVEKELQRLQAEGAVEPVETSDWAAPIVPVLKADKSSVRICGDFRVTVNPVSKLDKYL